MRRLLRGHATAIHRARDEACNELERVSLTPRPERAHAKAGAKVYFNFFFSRSWLVCPHFFFRQFTARWWSRA